MMTERSRVLFAKCFGREPRRLAAAPGRVNLIGEHTDYNEGFVLPMALDRYVLVAADRNPNQEVTLHSTATGTSAAFTLRGGVKRGEPDWSNYARGVIHGFRELGKTVPGFDAVIDSSLPYGGGLASSAALEVAFATLLEELTRSRLAPLEKAVLCQKAEHDFAGVPCGIMDQFASILGRKDHALLLDCRSRVATPVPMADPAMVVLIINTNIRHKLADGAYAQRRSECETAARTMGVASLRDANLEMLGAHRKQLGDVVFRRARHVLSENLRTLKAAEAFQNGEWQAAGQLMYASHESLRADYEVSCAELDAVVEIARSLGESEGVYGCRMTGGGFGGCAVGLAKRDAVQSLTRKLAQRYDHPKREPLTIFSCRPGAGARVLE